MTQSELMGWKKKRCICSLHGHLCELLYVFLSSLVTCINYLTVLPDKMLILSQALAVVNINIILVFLGGFVNDMSPAPTATFPACCIIKGRQNQAADSVWG